MLQIFLCQESIRNILKLFEEKNQLSDKIGRLKLKAEDGNCCLANIVDTEGDNTIALVCSDCENSYYFSNVVHIKTASQFGL